MSESIDSANLGQRFDSPPYFSPEVREMTEEWWDRTTAKLSQSAQGERLSRFGELRELLEPHGITDDRAMAELIMITRPRVRQQQAK